jgi:hypothetical protein
VSMVIIIFFFIMLSKSISIHRNRYYNLLSADTIAFSIVA